MLLVTVGLDLCEIAVGQDKHVHETASIHTCADMDARGLQMVCALR